MQCSKMLPRTEGRNRMKKPVPIVILSTFAMLNGGAAVVLGIATLLGSKVLFTPSGHGPNRIAMSQIFGPFAEQTGWIFIALGVLFILTGYGLFTLKGWARRALFWVSAIVAVLTLGAVVWGVFHGEWGVVVSGLLKVAAESGLCWYLSRPGVRHAFGS